MNKVPNDPYPIDAWLTIFKTTGTCPNLQLIPVSPYPYSCLRVNLPQDSSAIVEAGTYSNFPPSSTGILQADSTYYIRVDGYIGSYGAFGITSLTPAASPAFIWMGSMSAIWEDPTNWNNNTLPTIGSDVIINGGLPHYPELNSDASIRSLRLNPGATMTVKPGKKLTVLH